MKSTTDGTYLSSFHRFTILLNHFSVSNFIFMFLPLKIINSLLKFLFCFFSSTFFTIFLKLDFKNYHYKKRYKTITEFYNAKLFKFYLFKINTDMRNPIRNWGSHICSVYTFSKALASSSFNLNASWIARRSTCKIK